MGKIYSIGSIGSGRIFNSAHMPSYVCNGNIELRAIYDIDRDAAEKTKEHYSVLWKEKYGDGSKAPEVLICNSAEELMDKVDAVDICTNVRWHAYYSAMALEHNVSAMSEKPASRTWLESNRVVEVAEKSKAIFQLDDDNVFIPRYAVLKSIIEGGMIGELQHIWIARGYYGNGRKLWFWNPIENGGGCIMDYGSHAVNATWFLIGYDKVPVEVRAIGIKTRNRTRYISGKFRSIETDDDAHFKIRYVDPRNRDWIDVTIESTWTWPDFGRNGSDVRGFIQADGNTGSVVGYIDEEGHEYFKITNRTFGELLVPVDSIETEEKSFQDEIRNFTTCLDEGTQSMLDAKVAATTIAVINSAQLSQVRGGSSVTLDELKDYSNKIAATAANPWEAGDKITASLAEPYKL